MAEIIVSIPAFVMTSVYLGRQYATGEIEYNTPTISSATKTYDLTLIPYGSTINSATLIVTATPGYSGGDLLINGKKDKEQDITELVRPNSVGNYTTIDISFRYQAYGNMGGKGMHYSQCNVAGAEIVIDYNPGEGAVTDKEAYRAASLAVSREIQPRAYITYPSGARQIIQPDGIINYTINEGVKNGILLGAASSAVLNMRLVNDEGQWLPGGSMRGTRTPLGAKITVENGLKIDGEWQWQPAGEFTIDKFQAKFSDPAVTVSGYDAMGVDMEEEFVDKLSYPATLSQMLIHLSEQSGIGFVGSLAANGSVSIPSKPDWGEGCTKRKALGYICQAGASYGQINRQGVLAILPTWQEQESLEIGPDHYFSSVHDERRLTFNRVKITPANSEETVQAIADNTIGESKANTVTIEKNPVIVSSVAQQIADGICAALSGAVWQASDFRWRGDPSVTIGTRAMVEEPNGSVIGTTVMSQNIKWDQGLSMTCRCEIDIGRAFADLGYDETAIGGLLAGSKIQILESSGVAWYTLVDVDYGGLCLLLRDEIDGTAYYASSMPSGEYSSKYAGGSLDNAMEAFYDALPESTKAIVAMASVPVRSSAASNASSDVLSRHAFALSSTELGFAGSTLEGESIDYLGTVANGSKYWTREPLGGMIGYVYIINENGTRTSNTATYRHGRRPAFCVYKNTPVYSIDGGYAPVIGMEAEA